MIVGVVNISGRLKLLIGALSDITVTFLLRKLHISIFTCLLHINTMLSVLVLCISKKFVEMKLLLVMDSLRVFCLLSEEFSFSNLLVDPILLL